MLLFLNCFVPKEISYRINLKKGIIDINYLNICSDAKNDTTLSKDYFKLKGTYDSVDISLNNNRFKLLSKSLYQRKNTLNGNLNIQVRKADSIQGTLNYVKEFLFDEIKFKYTNGSIYLKNSKTKVFKLSNSNGKLITKPNSQTLIWDGNCRFLQFKISIKDDAFCKSLLNYYLQDASNRSFDRRCEVCSNLPSR